LQHGGDIAHKIIQPLGEALRSAEQADGRHLFAVGKHKVGLNADAVGEAGIVGAHNGLGRAGTDHNGGELRVTGGDKLQRLGRLAWPVDRDFHRHHGWRGAEFARHGGEPVLIDGADDLPRLGSF